MYLRSIGLHAFRSWAELDVRFTDRVTAIIGPNATGKTSVIEGAWYAATLTSHRTSTDAVMVTAGEDQAVVRVAVERTAVEGSTRTETVELEIVTKGRARARLGGAPVTRRRDVLGTLRAQIFAPERVAIVREDPSDRRRFADEVVVGMHPRHHATIKEYERALRQRNALLRDAAAGRSSLRGLDAWDEALVNAGAQLCAARATAIAAVAPHAQVAFEAVGGTTTFTLGYAPNVVGATAADPIETWAQAMRDRLAERAGDERIRGLTLVGPHRDDLEITLGALSARAHASHGEGWLAALALALGAHATLTEIHGDPPVLLLDDPFTLLDPSRRALAVRALPSDAQIIVTAADPAEVPAALGAATLDILEYR